MTISVESVLLADLIQSASQPVDQDIARARLKDLAKAGGRDMAAMLKRKPIANLLLGLAGHSPYLWRLAEAQPKRLLELLGSTPGDALSHCLSELRAACDRAVEDEEAMIALRAAKQRTHLLLALVDIGGVWDVVAVTGALSDLADASVSGALRYLLRRASASGRLNIANLDDPETGCGLVILALGKHGSRELNYSSDVDLVAFFDPEAATLPPDAAPGPIFVRLTQALARLLQERTGDGYSLRVDLRLRPDPGSTSVAISLPAAFDYYETLGQNWERAAFIKARPVAGDIAVGERFLADLAPFIWRKYFDYAAIADIHAMKRQIHAVRGFADIAVAGHDVKLGRGGIREI